MTEKNLKILKHEVVNLGPNSNLLRAYKAQYPKLTQLQFDTAIGLILGDAYIYSRNNAKTYGFKFEWGYKSKEYIFHVYEIFNEYILKEPHVYTRINKNDNEVKTWRMETFTGVIFKELGDLFIKNNKKIIIENLIKDYLTPRGLAYWYMDDGNRCYYKGTRADSDMNCVINTQGFTVEEVNILIKEINIKFNLDCTLAFNKKKPIINIPNRSYDIFYDLVKPYIIEQMKYKLPKRIKPYKFKL